MGMCSLRPFAGGRSLAEAYGADRPAPSSDHPPGVGAGRGRWFIPGDQAWLVRVRRFLIFFLAVNAVSEWCFLFYITHNAYL
jgi:hypothetical protein